MNVTPDPFSDGGRSFAPDAAVAHAVALLEQWADIVDVGAESTLPGAATPPACRRTPSTTTSSPTWSTSCG